MTFKLTTRILAFALSALLPQAVAAQTITLLHVGDSHSHVDAFGPRTPSLDGTIGGLAKVATVVGALRAQDPNALFVHAGDAFQGDLFFNAYFGVPELTILKQLGLDAMTVGNHEFDFGPGVLASALGAVGDFPMISANLDLSGFPPLQGAVQPRILKDVSGVRIGLFGLTTPDDPTMRPDPVRVDPDLGGIAAREVAELRAQGAQVVVLLSHLGLARDKALAAAVPGIDFIVSGHDHDVLLRPVRVAGPDGRTVTIVASGSFYQYVGRLRFSMVGGRPKLRSYHAVPVNALVPPAPMVKATVESLKTGIVAQYGDVYRTVVGRATREIPQVYDRTRPTRDTAVGDLITDSFRRSTGTEIGLTVNGLISEGLYAGPIVGADLFRSVSYGYDTATGLGFRLVTFDITGAELIKGMEICASFANLTTDFDVEVSGMRYQYDSSRPAFGRVLLESVQIGGQPIDPSRTYSVASNEGVAIMLPVLGVEVSNLQVLATPEYQALRDYVSALRVVSYAAAGRVQDVAVRGREEECRR
jgi:5'-nucleotidase/UDP-sugar diphosphatase